MAVQDEPRDVGANPLAQPVEALVRAVAGLVVDPGGRRVADEHVGGREPARKVRRLLLRVLVRPVAVADAALEPRERHTVELDPPEMQVGDPERRHVCAVVVAVDAELGQIHLPEGVDPGQVEVAAEDDGVRVVPAHPPEQVAGRRPVCEDEEPHLHVATHGASGQTASVRPSRRMLRRRIQIALPLLLAVAAGVATLTPSTGAQDVDKLRQRADSKRASERELSSDVARLGTLLRRLQADIAVVDRRSGEVQAELAEDQAKLGALRSDLREQRARVQRLKTHLRESQATLAARLVELYKAPDPDLLSVVLSAHDFADLVDQATFLQRIQKQDRRVITNVQRARTDANAAVSRLAKAEAAQQETTEAIAARSKALAGISSALASRRADYTAARAARAAALGNARSSRKSLEARIAKLEARRASYAGASSGGPWSIPWPIVQCESGGTNTPPNSAGASGYYQIIPSTWRLFGGSGPAAYLAPKAEQDRVAAKIWNGGAGASNWVCAALVAH